MARRSIFSDEQQGLGVDMSPLLDVVFILLIFFIVTTVFVKESGVEIDRPQALSASLLAKKSIFIAISNDGEVWYGGSRIGLAGIKPTIKQLIATNPQPVIIQADKQVSAELLIKVLDAIKLAGATQVNVATQGE